MICFHSCTRIDEVVFVFNNTVLKTMGSDAIEYIARTQTHTHIHIHTHLLLQNICSWSDLLYQRYSMMRDIKEVAFRRETSNKNYSSVWTSYTSKITALSKIMQGNKHI